MGVYVERSPRQEDWKYWGKKSVAGVANFVNCLWLSCGKAEQLLTLCHFLSKKKNLLLLLHCPSSKPWDTLWKSYTKCCSYSSFWGQALLSAESILFNILTECPFQNFHFYFSSLYFLFSKKFLNRKLAFSPESSFSFLTP